MGLLALGQPIDWEKAVKHFEYIKTHGIIQFLNVYEDYKDRSADRFFWGDEAEYLLVKFDEKEQKARLSLRGPDVICDLSDEMEELLQRVERGEGKEMQVWDVCKFQPEYGSFQVEGTPRRPYGDTSASLLQVQRNLQARRLHIRRKLGKGERLVPLSVFPMMGTGDFVDVKSAPKYAPDGGKDGVETPWGYRVRGQYSQSAYIPDMVIQPHPRFRTITRSVRVRRGATTDMRVPLFQDTHTQQYLRKQPRADTLPVYHPLRAVSDRRSIHMDCLAFGMGCCCVQVTFQARSIQEGRLLYDHLAVLSPILLAVTAASPVFHGWLADFDVRWSTISQSTDDRTPGEVGLSSKDGSGPTRPWTPLANPYMNFYQTHAAPGCESAVKVGSKRPRDTTSGEGKQNNSSEVFRKSRYDSISVYLGGEVAEPYQDLTVRQRPEAFKSLRKAGVDAVLSKHLAHIFARDPLVVFNDCLDQVCDETSTDHFESLQSTNWQNMRFKAPPVLPERMKKKSHGTAPGWRVEFRTMELQCTDFENAAFVVFVTLLSRAILFFRLNLYVPMSRVEENMKRAHLRNACTEQRFHWRDNILPNHHMTPAQCTQESCPKPRKGDRKMAQLTIKEIFLGKGSEHPQRGWHSPGLLGLVRTYLDYVKCAGEVRAVVDLYLEFIEDRVSGRLMTNARYLRHLITAHPQYRRNSRVTHPIAYAVLARWAQICEQGDSSEVLDKYGLQESEAPATLPYMKKLPASFMVGDYLERYAELIAGKGDSDDTERTFTSLLGNVDKQGFSRDDCVKMRRQIFINDGLVPDDDETFGC